MTAALDMDRRSLLGGGAAALAFAVPAAATTPAVDRRAWEAAMAKLVKIETEDAAFTPGWWEAHKRCAAECDAIPHVDLGIDPHTGWMGRVSTANRQYVTRARREVADLDAGRMRFDPIPDLQEHERLMRELVAAADDCDAKVQAIRDQYDMDRRDERAEQLGDQLADAQEALMKLPAPDGAALRWKLERLRDEDGDSVAYSAEYVGTTFADVARLLPEGR